MISLLLSAVFMQKIVRKQLFAVVIITYIPLFYILMLTPKMKHRVFVAFLQFERKPHIVFSALYARDSTETQLYTVGTIIQIYLS